MAELAAWIFTAEGATTVAAAATATAAVVQASKAGAKGPGMVAKSPQATEAELSGFKQEQRDLLRKRRASLATQSRLEEPKLGKQSLLGA